jgi:hypothetical protein
MEMQPDTIEVTPEMKAALEEYARVERERMNNPLIKELITWRSIAQKILMNAVEKQGYYRRRRKP